MPICPKCRAHYEDGTTCPEDGAELVPDAMFAQVDAALKEGDMVGDPFKDTSGPALNILLKLMAIVSLVFAPVFLEFEPLLDRI